MEKSNRVLIIGLDGATWDVLDPWMKDGSLPNLAKLRSSGSWGKLFSTIPPITAPAWSTFMTGKKPGKHGVFHFIPLFGKDGAEFKKSEIVNSRSIKSHTLWDILGHHGRHVILINVPMTYPPRPVNGYMITGLLTPKSASIFTHPPELSNDLDGYIIDLDRFIDTKPFMDSHDPELIAPNLPLVQDFRDMLEKRAETSLSLMSSKIWDVFMVVFTGTDRLGHYLWPYHRNPDTNDPPGIQELCHAVHSYYVRLDQLIGELIEEAGGRDISIIVMSDHGMGPRFTKRFHCNNWLHQQGWLQIRTDGISIANPDNWARRFRIPRDKLGRIILKIPGLAGSRVVKKAVKSRSATIDMDRSQAYCLPVYNNIACIRIKLRGEEKLNLRQEIIQALLKIKDPVTGEQVIQQIILGEDYFHGPYAKNIPEIIIILKPDYGWGHYISSYSSIITKASFPTHEGDHRQDGIFIADGPKIAAEPEPLADLTIQDIAPTILYLLDLPSPSDMDGRVLTEILKPGIIRSQPINLGEPLGFWPDMDELEFYNEVLSDEDEAEIQARLQALGYLE